MGKFKFNEGDKIGPLSMELLKRTTKNYRNEWYGEFICPVCQQKFEAIISKIASGHTKSCGCLTRPKDITNQRFGRLIALYPNGKTSNGITLWHCQCDCGTEKDIRITSLNNGETKSCGCLRSDFKAQDLTNKRFGHLVALKRVANDTNYAYCMWECRCDCGKTIILPSRSLVSGNTQTCGTCYNKSLQEEKIAYILKSLNIDFEMEKTFDDCRNPRTGWQLRFDFYLPKENILIEYDGEQHFYYEKSSRWNTKENYEATKYRDEIKNQYCLNHNIRLIRIPYTQKTLLSKEFLFNLIFNNGKDMELVHERKDMEE